MSKTEQLAIAVTVVLIVIYLAVLITGFVTGKFSYLLPLLNIVTGFTIVMYWILRQVQITQHVIETREIAVLSFEVIAIGCAIYYIAALQRNSWLKIMQYIIFGMHLLALLLFLVFMLTFKIKRLA